MYEFTEKLNIDESLYLGPRRGTFIFFFGCLSPPSALRRPLWFRALVPGSYVLIIKWTTSRCGKGGSGGRAGFLQVTRQTKHCRFQGPVKYGHPFGADRARSESVISRGAILLPVHWGPEAPRVCVLHLKCNVGGKRANEL